MVMCVVKMIINKKMMGLGAICTVLALGLTGCSGHTALKSRTDSTSSVVLKPFSEMAVCQAAVSKMFYVPLNDVIATKTSHGIVHLSYTAQNKKVWDLKCRLSGDQILWADNTPDAHWKNGPSNPLLWFQVANSDLYIYENFNRVKTDCNPTLYSAGQFSSAT